MGRMNMQGHIKQSIRNIRGRLATRSDGSITFARRKQLMFRTIIIVSLVSFVGGYVRGAGGVIIFLLGMGVGVYVWRKAMVPALVMAPHRQEL